MSMVATRQERYCIHKQRVYCEERSDLCSVDGRAGTTLLQVSRQVCHYLTHGRHGCVHFVGGRQHQGGGGAGNARAMVAAAGRGGGTNSNTGAKIEKTQWLALIDDLNKK